MARRIKRGDSVIVVAGADKGRTGKVLRVDARKSRVYVENVSMQFKHVHRSQQNPKGGRIQREGPINISNVQIWSEKAASGQRFRVEDRESGRVRVGLKDGEALG